MWVDLQKKCSDVKLEDKTDRLVWLLDSKGRFTVKSFYVHLKTRQNIFPHRNLWKIEVPFKIKNIFVVGSKKQNFNQG